MDPRYDIISEQIKLHPEPINSREVPHPDTRILNLKLRLTQAAMCHQYARTEYENTLCVIRRGELLEEMEMYHSSYQAARDGLYILNPGALNELEMELRSQKQLVFGEYHA